MKAQGTTALSKLQVLWQPGLILDEGMDRLADFGTTIEILQFDDYQTLGDLCLNLLHQLYSCLHGALE